MNLVLDSSSFIRNSVFFNDPVKNTVMNDSNFIRIIYSNKDFVLNGIYIKIDINKDLLQKRSLLNKLPDNNNDIIIKYIEDLEQYIIDIYNSDKLQSYKIKEQLNYLLNKINNCSNNRSIFSYILKISGIWETQTMIGLTYKFIYL